MLWRQQQGHRMVRVWVCVCVCKCQVMVVAAVLVTLELKAKCCFIPDCRCSCGGSSPFCLALRFPPPLLVRWTGSACPSRCTISWDDNVCGSNAGRSCEAVMQKGATPPARCNIWAATKQALVAAACCGCGRLSVEAVVGWQWAVRLLTTVMPRNERAQQSTSQRPSLPNNYQNLIVD